MKDERKTKAQLIEELKAERQKTAGGDVSGVERQLAVERVRAEAMAMRSSDDLLKVVGLMYHELIRLGMDTINCSIDFVKEETERIYTYEAIANPKKQGYSWTSPDLVEVNDDVVVFRFDDAEGDYKDMWKTGKPWHTQYSEAEAQCLFDEVATRFGLDAGVFESWDPAALTFTRVPFEYGAIAVALKLSESQITIVQEFKDAISLGYIRFLDIQKVEEQNRELQVEAALERVRSRTLAMQTTDDLPSVSAAVFREFRVLYPETLESAIAVVDEPANLINQWSVVPEGAEQAYAGASVYEGDIRVALEQWEASKMRSADVFFREAFWACSESEGLKHFANRWSPDEVRELIHSMEEYGQWTPELSQGMLEWWEREPFGLNMDLVQHKHGYLFLQSSTATTSASPLTASEIEEELRFAEVFSFAYDRFLELQQKEDQNRELEIERSLERVRTVVAEMESSDDIGTIRDRVRTELQVLGINCEGVGINRFDAVGREVTFITEDPMPVDPIPSLRTWADHWSGRETFVRQYTKETLEGDLTAALTADLISEEKAQEARVGPNTLDRWVVDAFFDHGSLAMNRPGAEPFSDDDIALFERFTEVFALGYRRYLDLTAAEERARQATLDHAVEHIRAEAMAMKSTDDIRRVVGVVRGELIELGFSDRFPIAINYLDEKDDAHTYAFFAISNPRQRGLNWQSPNVWEVDEHTAAGLVIWDESHVSRALIATQEIVRINDIFDPVALEDFHERTGLEPGSIEPADVGTHVTCIPFAHGQIAPRGDDYLTDEQVEVVRQLCDGLSLGFTRFRDFQQLEQASLNKSQFLRRMSHDLRSPMNAIIGYSRLLQRRLADQIQERDARNLANIETSSGNLLNLINDILDLSRIEAGRIEVDVQPVDVRNLADECADALESIVQEGVELRRDLSDLNEIQTDPDRLRQVVMNLLGNATKFTDSGSITLSLRSADGAVELSVADTGVGIPAEDLPHIFDEFRQVERQGGEQTEGTGLGLAIAKKTVVLLGGTLTAESEVGVGTTFTVRIGDYESD